MTQAPTPTDLTNKLLFNLNTVLNARNKFNIGLHSLPPSWMRKGDAVQDSLNQLKDLCIGAGCSLWRLPDYSEKDLEMLIQAVSEQTTVYARELAAARKEFEQVNKRSPW